MRLVILPAAMAMTLSAAQAQTVIMNSPVSQKSPNEIRIQVSVNFFVPGPVDASEESFQAQEQVRKSIYERAGRECELLRATLANTCRLEAVRININRQIGRQPEGFTAAANMTYQVALK